MTTALCCGRRRASCDWRPGRRTPSRGGVMEIWTTQPGIQFYTGNFLDGSTTAGGHGRHAAFCLETQHFPDSPNHTAFPSTTLQPGQELHEVTVHRFSVRSGTASSWPRIRGGAVLAAAYVLRPYGPLLSWLLQLEQLIDRHRFDHLLLSVGPADPELPNCADVSQPKGHWQLGLRSVAARRHNLLPQHSVWQFQLDPGTDRVAVAPGPDQLHAQPVVAQLLVIAQQPGRAANGRQQ